MATFRVTVDATVLAAPSFGAASLGIARAGSTVEGTPDPSDLVFMKGTVSLAGVATTGFLMRSKLVEASSPVPEPLLGDADVDFFCQLVTDAARTYAVDRDYLMAVAYTESAGLKQLGNVNSSAIGPFQFIEETWNRLVASSAAMPLGLAPSDRGSWRFQPAIAALLAREIQSALNTALGRVPKLGEMYCGHVFGTSGASKFLAGNRARPFKDAYIEATSPASYEKVLKGNASVIMDGATGRTVDGVVGELGRRLDEGYLGAATIIDRQSPATRFVHAENGDPHWLMVAREELYRGVYEYPGANNNARITSYHAASGTANSIDEVPWCGAFVTFCMKQTRDPIIIGAIVNGPATAASWLGWGKQATAPYSAGTVVVLKPQAAGSSGHVGFLLPGAVVGKIKLLAGNQGNPAHVSVIEFADTEVAAGGYRSL